MALAKISGQLFKAKLGQSLQYRNATRKLVTTFGISTEPLAQFRQFGNRHCLKITVSRRKHGRQMLKIFRNILKEYGITYEDIKKNGGKVVTNGFDDIANMVKDGQIDVFVWIGPGEAWFIVDVSGSVPLKFLNIESGIAKKVAATLGCNVGTLPAEFYKGKVGPDVTTLWDTNAIIVRDNLDEESAYRLTQAVIEGRDDIALANPAWKSIDPAKAWQGTVYPLHPGAARYYKEKGYMN